MRTATRRADSIRRCRSAAAHHLARAAALRTGANPSPVLPRSPRAPRPHRTVLAWLPSTGVAGTTRARTLAGTLLARRKPPRRSSRTPWAPPTRRAAPSKSSEPAQPRCASARGPGAPAPLHLRATRTHGAPAPTPHNIAALSSAPVHCAHPSAAANSPVDASQAGRAASHMPPRPAGCGVRQPIATHPPAAPPPPSSAPWQGRTC
jgi:hypothetical protein